MVRRIYPQNGHWWLVVNGHPVAEAPRDSVEPPFVLTEGLPFVRRGNEWVYRAPLGRRLFWPLVVLAGVVGAAGMAWKPLIALAVALAVIAVILDAQHRSDR